MGTKLRAQAKQQYFDSSGNPAAGYKVYTYEAGTSANKATYTDNAQTATNTNPVILDSRGEADIWWNGTYKVKFTDGSDVEVWTVDNYGAGEDDAASAASSLITNHSFETDTEGDNLPDSWDLIQYSGSTNAVVTTDQDHGQKSMKFTSTGSGGGYITTSSFIEVSPNDPLSFNFSLMASVADVRNVVQILWYTANQVASSTASTDVYDDSTTNPTSWTLKRYQVVPPSDAYYCKVRMYGCHSSDATSGSTWYDNVVLVAPVPIVVKGADIASANDMVLLDDGNYNDVTGSTTTNGMTTPGSGNPVRKTHYDGAVLLKHATAPSAGYSQLWLPRSADYTTAANDEIEWIYDDTYWRLSALTRSSGQALAPVAKGYLYKLTLSNDTDTDHDIAVATGQCLDSGNTVLMDFTSVLTKQIDATWAAGDDAGGMNDGETVGNTTWYHYHALSSADGSTVDYGFDTSLTAVNLLADTAVIAAGLTKYRRIGAVLTDGSANIQRFFVLGNHNRKYIQWRTISTDFSDTTTGATNRTARVPLGIQIEAQIHIQSLDDDISDFSYAYGPDMDGAAAASANTMGGGDTANTRGQSTRMIITNTSSQYATRATPSPTSFSGSTIGFYEDL